MGPIVLGSVGSVSAFRFNLQAPASMCTFIAADAVPEVHAANVESISGEGA